MGGAVESKARAEPVGPVSAALHHRPWRAFASLSRLANAVERFLFQAGFDRAPWLAVGFAAGVLAWFALPAVFDWLALIVGCAGIGLAALSVMAADGRFPVLRQAIVAMAVMVALGCATVWTKSTIVGVEAIARPMVAQLRGTVLSREERPADQRLRLVLATREPETGRAIRVRLNLPLEQDQPALQPGALVRVKARLMPPAPPMLPGSYDFARAAWFAGLAATGSITGPVVVERAGEGRGWLAGLRARLSDHVLERLPGPAGGIAAALASGDRGAIAKADDAAMRDAGLAHLLSISGLHVSAVIAAAWFMAMKLLALFPALALRVRLPLVAAGTGALAGLFYTLLTGAEVPTVRSCIGALLVLAALALGREPLSLRMLAVAALAVMVLWPEAVVGPSFQMSFAAVIAIIALHGSAPVRAFLAPREESWLIRTGRSLVMLLATGLAIELALMPIGLFHFHRAGVYGSLVNVVAIPLTTFVSMPAIALGLMLDAVRLGAPAWWVADQAIGAMLALAHWVSERPGAVTSLPAMGRGSIALFVAGGLWLALWRGRVRLLGLIALGAGALSLAFLRPPDLLVSGDGQHIGITGLAGEHLVVLRQGKSSFARENLAEVAGMQGEVAALADLPQARCSPDFCAIDLRREGRTWRLLMTRSRERVEERAVAAACARADIVIADRWLPRSCRPAWFKADRAMLARTGGLAIIFADDPTGSRVRTVADTQGAHGWWQGTAWDVARKRASHQGGAQAAGGKLAAPRGPANAVSAPLVPAGTGAKREGDHTSNK